MGSIFIAADHRGFLLKEFLKENLRQDGLNVVDLGNKIYDKDDDYVEIGLNLAQKTVTENTKGILICASGIGMSIVANKVNGTRAALCLSEKQAKMTREHNDANILCLAADLVDQENNLEIVKVFLETLFSSEERHIKRIQLIKKYENTKTS
ncbi:MAG: RpiB/LacA/LacB family sugar-phosphate isomerase [Candidatus Shapirobacteria bacterium]|nr:RpiB/LacA/LacB family sugar-phosphate isomerase [Candidatus Shapirobacteria bacterium]